MKKNYLMLLCVALLVSSAAFAQKTYEVANLRGDAYTMDGIADEDFWSNLDSAFVDVPIDDPVDGAFDYSWLCPIDNRETNDPLDFRAYFKMAWHTDGLVAYFNVQDDEITRGWAAISDSGTSSFDGDKIEFYIRSSNIEARGTGWKGNMNTDAVESGYFQFVVFPEHPTDADREGAMVTKTGGMPPPDGTDWPMAFNQGQLGYSFEILFPWDSLRYKDDAGEWVVPDPTAIDYDLLFDVNWRDNDEADANGDEIWNANPDGESCTGDEEVQVAIWAWSENDNVHTITNAGAVETADWVSAYPNFGKITLLQDTYVAIDQNFTNNKVKYYPNPVQDVLRITTGDVTSVSIFDVVGKKILTENVFDGKVNLKNLKEGVYVVNFYNNDTYVASGKIYKVK